MAYIYVVTREGDAQPVIAGTRKYTITNWLVENANNPAGYGVDLDECWVSRLKEGDSAGKAVIWKARDYLATWEAEVKENHKSGKWGK